MRYCLIYFFSIEDHAEYDYEVAVFRLLFHKSLSRWLFEVWEQLKEKIFTLRKQKRYNDTRLKEMFIEITEVYVIASIFVPGRE